ncbi:squalene cyclase [Actinocrispum sp. NPDC049592]|uniref:squalene cyclase n=1 Tax=Actinocrispum sp. NPDC049592 TaxID=3154835 RepID=UPI0034459F57
MDVIDWLLDSDPAIRWQVLRDLTDAPARQVAAERARVANEGWGSRLLALQQPHGQWASGLPAFRSEAEERWWHSLAPDQHGTLFPMWTSTAWSLVLLRIFGAEPDHPAVRRAVGLVRENVRWEHDGEPFFAGEVEPCINGRTVALGAYFGVEVTPIVERLLGEQMADGGWNCEQENGSTRASFHTTIDVLEGLLAYEQATGRDVRQARLRGQEYLLERRMARRLSTGEPIEHDRTTGAPAAWTQFSFPAYWHYDVLRGLDYLRAAGSTPDVRVAEAIDLVRSKRDADGRWPVENPHPGELHFAIDDHEGRPSRWNTLRAMRVLTWFENRHVND